MDRSLRACMLNAQEAIDLPLVVQQAARRKVKCLEQGHLRGMATSHVGRSQCAVIFVLAMLRPD